VLRTKKHLGLIRPVSGALAVHTMLFPEIIAANEVDGLPLRVTPDPREVKMAEQLIDSLTVKWKQRARRADVVDLMVALEVSVKASKSRKRTKKSA
jgi:DNA end-binding protein Ku